MKIVLLLFLILTSESYSQIVSASPDYPRAVAELYHTNGTTKIEKIFSDIDLSDLKRYSEYYDNGQLRLKAEFKNSKLHNELIAYWRNGNLKRKELYNNGILVKGICWDQNENEITCSEFEMPAQMTEDK